MLLIFDTASCGSDRLLCPCMVVVWQMDPAQQWSNSDCMAGFIIPSTSLRMFDSTIVLLENEVGSQETAKLSKAKKLTLQLLLYCLASITVSPAKKEQHGEKQNNSGIHATRVLKDLCRGGASPWVVSSLVGCVCAEQISAFEPGST